MTTATNSKPEAPTAAMTRGDVAVISPPRLPYHPEIEARYGVDKAGWRALVDAVFPSAQTTDAVILALSYCRARGLDPFKRMVHIVPMWNSALGRNVETVWPGIGEHRATAMRTGQYGGCDPTNFGPMVKHRFVGRVPAGKGEWKTEEVEITFPEWAQITVYRVVQGQRMPVPGPRVYWTETYSRRTTKADVPNDRWCRAPSQMLEKCAEAAALRKAFPEEMGDGMTAEEAEGRETDIAGALEQARDVTPPAKPTRADFAPKPKPITEAQAVEAERAMDREYVATVSDRMPDDPTPHDEDGVVAEPEPKSAEPWSTDGWPVTGAPKPTPAGVLAWARDVGAHVQKAPTIDALKEFLDRNAVHLKWFRDRYGEPSDALQEIIDNKLAELSP